MLLSLLFMSLFVYFDYQINMNEWKKSVIEIIVTTRQEFAEQVYFLDM